MARPLSIEGVYGQLVRHHGGWAQVCRISGASPASWRRWAQGTQRPTGRNLATPNGMFQAAGVRSPWADDAAQPLFDPETLEPLFTNVAVFRLPVIPLLIEDLADAALHAYHLDLDEGCRVMLRAGAELSTWEVVVTPSQSYAIRLPDGRLIQYVAGSTFRETSDSANLQKARANTARSLLRARLADAV